MNLQCIWNECENQGLDLSNDRQELVSKFLNGLYEVNSHTNLTRVLPDEAPMRHIVDSLLVVPIIPHGVRVLDIGCGPGFPAWIIAWARPDLTVVAMDATVKMQKFLGDNLLPNLLQMVHRAEDVIEPEHFDFVTGRALAPFGIQAELSAAWIRVGGLFVPFRTASERELIERANIGMLGLKLVDMIEAELPDESGVRLFPVFEKLKSTPKEYPRMWGKIKAKPLAKG
ncbi:MAG: 16S rRNA (guanine(527)-N(7))-methyltransferase RsmG [Fimbriimonadaceae bacterium]